MSEQSKIEWTDSTFNPWIGCTKVGPGCDHCYAEALMDTRHHRVKWGSGNSRSRTSAANWKLPERWNREDFCECTCGWRGVLREPRCPVCDRNGIVSEARRRVFCASLADVFDNEVDPAWREDLFALIDSTLNLDWLLLTKRIGNVERMLSAMGRPNFPRNVWLGITVVNQPEADRDIPKLWQAPASVRFLSVEPMLGEIDLTPWLPHEYNAPSGSGQNCATCGTLTTILHHPYGKPWLDWVIAGGESGHNARPSHPAWYRNLRDQCASAGVPFLFKQWGEFEPREEWSPHLGGGRFEPMLAVMKDGSQCPHDVAPQDVGAHRMARVGKKAAGRKLDGADHNGYPLRDRRPTP
jgi:protein gp37